MRLNVAIVANRGGPDVAHGSKRDNSRELADADRLPTSSFSRPSSPSLAPPLPPRA